MFLYCIFYRFPYVFQCALHVFNRTHHVSNCSGRTHHYYKLLKAPLITVVRFLVFVRCRRLLASCFYYKDFLFTDLYTFIFLTLYILCEFSCQLNQHQSIRPIYHIYTYFVLSLSMQICAINTD